MRIAFLVESLKPAGAERVVLELARAGHAKRCEAHVITLRNSETPEVSPHWNPREIPLFHRGPFHWPSSAPLAALRLRSKLSRLRPDVLEIHTPKAAVIAALAGTAVPALWVLHGHDVCWDGATARLKLSRELQRWVRRRLGGHVAAVSSSLADHAASGLAMAREEVTVIPNGVDTERFSFEDRTPTDDIVVCVLGRLVQWKGPRQALEAFGWLRKALPAARLWFIGDGPMRKELTAEVTVRGWDNAVTFWGELQQPEVQLRQATVLWHPSESEGFGIACAEAMAMGVPVAGFDVRGVRELLLDGCGVLVAPKDAEALARQTDLLVRDGNRYHSTARMARARIESEYSLERMLTGHYQLMQRLCSGETTSLRHAASGASLGPHDARLEESRN